MKNSNYRISSKLFITAIFLLTSLTINAASISSLYVFGDSLSDTRTSVNSDGPLWAEYLAPQLGFSYDGSTNFALSGSNTPDIINQISTFQATTSVADPNALYVLWGGANDIFQSLIFPSSTPTETIAINAANNISNGVDILTSMGAQNILVPNLPDLGFVPADGTGFATRFAEIFNTQLQSNLALNTNTRIADVFGLHHDIISNPSAYGFFNVSDACSLTANDCNTSLFWDLIHPTTAGHQIFANEMYNIVTVVPLPAATWLFIAEIIGLFSITKQSRYPLINNPFK